MLGVDGSISGKVEIIGRSPEPYGSTFPMEIVTFRVSDRDPLTVLCKYSRPERCQLPAWHRAHGHRHGIAYETRVYRHVLKPLCMTTPQLLGTHEGRGGRTWLALEYLNDCMRVKSSPADLEHAAAWIGGFHARNESRLSEPALGFLNEYTADYYRGWARRTLAYARRHRRDYRRVASACESFERSIDALLEPPLTIVHGEYYPSNVLVRDSVVHPVDWESAAIAAGEVDLAALTEHWPAEVAERCEQAYVRARWPAGCANAAFADRLSVARSYTLLRQAGVPRAWEAPEGRAYYLSRLAGE